MSFLTMIIVFFLCTIYIGSRALALPYPDMAQHQRSLSDLQTNSTLVNDEDDPDVKRAARFGRIGYNRRVIVFPNEVLFYNMTHERYADRLFSIYSHITPENRHVFDNASSIKFSKEQWETVRAMLDFDPAQLDIVNDPLLQKLFRNDLAAFDRSCAPFVLWWKETFREIPKERPIVPLYDCEAISWAKSAFNKAAGNWNDGVKSYGLGTSYNLGSLIFGLLGWH
jgi:hypothetical protein